MGIYDERANGEYTYDRILLQNAEYGNHVKVRIEAINWEDFGYVETEYGLKVVFYGVNGEEYTPINIYCEDEYECKYFFNKTKHHVFRPNKFGNLYCFCNFNKKPGHYEYYENGANRAAVKAY